MTIKSTLTAADFKAAASRLGVEIAVIQAVAEVESGDSGAFFADGHPAILFERHLFHRFTGGLFDGEYPELSNAAPGGYGKLSDQVRKLNQAMGLDCEAAQRACSWGRFQILGDNHKLVNFPTVSAFVTAMKSGEVAHLDAFVTYILARKLGNQLRTKDWAAFARAYNGPEYQKFSYDTKLAAAYRRFISATA